MSRRARRRGRKKRKERRSPWLWLIVGGAAVLVIGVGLAKSPLAESEPPVTPQVFGSPRLVVDQPMIDEGYVKLNVPVRTSFKLTNVGDQPLKILDEPQVKLIEGC